MENGASFLLELALILIFANLGGLLVVKIGQPAVLGQIIAGLIIGPAIFNIVGPNEFINKIAEIGVVLLMFIAGAETDLNDLKKSAGSSLIVALGGIIFPFIGGYIASILLFPSGGYSQALFVGTILTATSISITVQSLREFDKIRSRVGATTIGAAIMDDVLGIVLLTVVAGIALPSQSNSVLLVIGKIILFFILALIAGKIFVIFMNKHSSRMLRNRNVASLALIICFLLAFTAEEFGVAAIIGAYFTGAIFSLTPYNNRVTRDIQNIAITLFVPIFFVNIGLNVNLSGISSVIIPAFIIILVAISGKILGSGLGAKLTGFNMRESAQIGIGMIPRAEVALIIANLGRSTGLINDALFTSAILMVVVTTLITPSMLKAAFKVD